MKRLIVTGLPCPPQVWEDFFGNDPEQRILPIWEVFENTTSSDPRVMSRYVTEQIEAFQPDSIVCHDLGVPLVLMSLLRLRRRNIPLKARVTIFNGAFRKFDIFKANHPFRVQIMTLKKAVREVEAQGGSVDHRLKPHLGRIRSMYRYVILFGLTEKLSSLFGLESLLGLETKVPVRLPLQVIASKNDPYIPFESVEQLQRDFPARRFVHVDYGHYPYSVSPEQIVPYVREFESSDSV